MIVLKGRTIEKEITPELGKTLLDLAVQHKIDWNHACTRGTCAKCRCKIEAGYPLLNAPTKEELARLTKEEIEQGFRLGCQATMVQDGEVKALNKPYFP
ncbi:2Fe-2S iron-sulfur cluster-binding protein [Longirhabdus pacifica]|uniref:2Fe-2S iron-sulfur cluster-binding protein n=1 Tax=Longirhabdus pacifica TaxID=2305227 RepID=UPI001008EE3C|nr:2Fe-2S iron-sulfur cluster-binding protein [Longirhabdus pacifica]